MPTIPRPRRGGESPSPARRPLTAPIRTAISIRVYSELPDGSPHIIDVPLGRTTCGAVAEARAAGGSRIRIHALDRDGVTIDRVVVR
jgi:hypothetical protein